MSSVVLAGLMIMASHRTFSGQNMHMYSQIKFGHTNLLYIINGKFIEFAENNECPTKFGPYHKHCFSGISLRLLTSLTLLSKLIG